MAKGAAPLIYASAALEPGILGYQGSGLGLHVAHRVPKAGVGRRCGGRAQAAFAAFHLAEGAQAPIVGIGTGAKGDSARLMVTVGRCFADGDW